MKKFVTMARMVKRMKKDSLKRDATILCEKFDTMYKADKKNPKLKEIKLAWKIVRKEIGLR